DGSECALRQQKDHKACRTGICRLPSRGASCCLGRLRPAHRRDRAAFRAAIDTMPLPHPCRRLTLAEHAPQPSALAWRFSRRLGAVCGSEAKYPKTCKQETTLFTIITNLLHFGMTVVFAGQ